MKSQAPYVPRTDLGFPDRRRSSRFELCFLDEAEIESWENCERVEEVEHDAPRLTDRELIR